jgi:hypothetical protein
LTQDEIDAVLATLLRGQEGFEEKQKQKKELLIKNAVTAEKVLEAIREPWQEGCYTDFALSDEEAESLIVRYVNMYKGV